LGKPVVPDVLTRRERDVVVALCRPALSDGVFTEPATVREIAAELVVTDAAVKQHLLHLYDKFEIPADGSRRRAALAREAIRRNVIGLAELQPPARRGRQDGAMLQEGRSAYEAHDWETAFEFLDAADSAEPLGAVDLERLADAGMWTNRHEHSLERRRRAYQAHLRAGDAVPAAAVALMLALHHWTRHESAVAAGWLAKAERELGQVPDVLPQALLAIAQAMWAEVAADWNTVLECARHAHAIARDHGSADFEALGCAFEGLALTQLGEVAAGMRLLDEAMASALGGALGPLATGVIYCRMLCACVDLQDFGRADEWTTAVSDNASTPGLAALPGDCRTHRAAVLIRSGAWAEGAVEAERAVEEAPTFDLTHLGIAFSELAEIRLRRGDFDAAEEALLRAREFGDSGVEPCLTLLRLARGDVTGAGLGIDAALAAASGRLQRARLLPTKVEASLLAGNPETAAAAATDLEETAASYGSPTLLAAAKHAIGAVALATEAREQAVAHLAAAQQLWQKARSLRTGTSPSAPRGSTSRHRRPRVEPGRATCRACNVQATRRRTDRCCERKALARTRVGSAAIGQPRCGVKEADGQKSRHGVAVHT
jgi:tetratricopeptide (TPR) repeat protein